MKAQIFTASLTCLLLASPVMYADDNSCASLFFTGMDSLHLKATESYEGQPVTVTVNKANISRPQITFYVPDPTQPETRTIVLDSDWVSCKRVTDYQYNYTWDAGLTQCESSTNSGALMISIDPNKAPSKRYSGYLQYDYCLPPVAGSGAWISGKINSNLTQI